MPILIGTSGWMYKDWGEVFYPPDLKKGHLAYLSARFKTVEVNTSFYHLPQKSTFQKWHDETPKDFIFSVKLSRYITHQKKLKGVRRALERFLKRAAPMEKKLGVILIQLPPSLAFERRLFLKFLEDINVVRKRTFAFRAALEPRHQSWLKPRNHEVVAHELRKLKIALVFAHSAKIVSYKPSDENTLTDLVYIRFHGPSEFGASRYGPRRLRPWASRMVSWDKHGSTVFAYFNNDQHGHAIHDARTLLRLCGLENASPNR